MLLALKKECHCIEGEGEGLEGQRSSLSRGWEVCECTSCSGHVKESLQLGVGFVQITEKNEGKLEPIMKALNDRMEPACYFLNNREVYEEWSNIFTSLFLENNSEDGAKDGFRRQN